MTNIKRVICMTLFAANLLAGTVSKGPLSLSDLENVPGLDGYHASGDILFRTANHKSTTSVRRWPNGVVYHRFADDVTQTNQDLFMEAAEAMSNITVITLVERTDQVNFVEVRNHPDPNFFGGFSELGMVGGQQIILLSDWSNWTMQHEIGHTLGLLHEQSRPDRDQFIDIQWDRIFENYAGNFDISRGAETYSDYDFMSIMHYRWNAFSRDGGATIVPKPGFEQFARTMGGMVLSDLDIQGINQYYNFESNPQSIRWIPHLTTPEGGFQTEVTFTNTRNEPGYLSLFVFDKNGVPLPGITLELVAFEYGKINVNDYRLLNPGTQPSHFQIDGSGFVRTTASYRFDSDQGVTAHVQEVTNTGTLFISYASEWDKSWEGMAIVNLGNEPSHIEGVRKNKQGDETFRATIISDLAPNGKHIMVFDDLFDDDPEQQIQIISSQESVLLFLRGSREGTRYLYQTEPLIVQ